MTQSSFSAAMTLSALSSALRGSTEDRQRFTIDGREPQEVIFPEALAQVSDVLRSAAEHGLAVAPVGQGAFLHLGGIPRRYDLALSTRHLARIVDYQPTDMTVTVEAGITVARLQTVLGEHGQWLPVDPPLPEQVTVGGLIATNLSGPARLSQGTTRDFLIGLKAVQADGTVVKGGGRVVKNVAGYDLPKLYCGSFGTLGVIVEATFKVRPRPETQTVLLLSFPSAEKAMELALQLLGAELQPFFLELANFDPLCRQKSETEPYRLIVGVAGIAEEVSYQRARIRELLGNGTSADEEWEGGNDQPVVRTLRDFPMSGEAALRCKASVVPTQVALFCKEVEEEARLRDMPVQLLAHAGNGVVYSRFSRPESGAPGKVLSLIDWLRVLTKKLDGYLVVEAVDPALKDRVDVWGHVGSAFPLMKKLKDTLDPHGLLNPGRFVGGI